MNRPSFIRIRRSGRHAWIDPGEVAAFVDLAPGSYGTKILLKNGKAVDSDKPIDEQCSEVMQFALRSYEEAINDLGEMLTVVKSEIPEADNTKVN